MKVVTSRVPGTVGRPAGANKNDVDARLLDAATQLFLKSGFDGTSCDHVAQHARAGKASIYARYANKTALFVAVIQTNLERLFDAGGTETFANMSLRQRMIDAGRRVVDNALQPDAVALLRLIVAEAPKLEIDALDATSILQKIGVRHVALAIAGPAHTAEAVEKAGAALAPAAVLIDAVLMPALLHALLGRDIEQLRASALNKLALTVDALIASEALEERYAVSF
jgi:AcrR family transcriptional regulator